VDRVDLGVIADRMQRRATILRNVRRISKHRFSSTSPTTDGELRLAVFVV
jgi:hypothetical protein